MLLGDEQEWLIQQQEKIGAGAEVYSRCADTIEWTGIVGIGGVEIGPELDKEEGVLGALAIQLLQTIAFLRELVLNLSHINWLQKKRGLKPDLFC